MRRFNAYPCPIFVEIFRLFDMLCSNYTASDGECEPNNWIKMLGVAISCSTVMRTLGAVMTPDPQLEATPVCLVYFFRCCCCGFDSPSTAIRTMGPDCGAHEQHPLEQLPGSLLWRFRGVGFMVYIMCCHVIEIY
jgi:hypothetical protein